MPSLRVYKTNLISTIVDNNTSWVAHHPVYKTNLISTIVDPNTTMLCHSVSIRLI